MSVLRALTVIPALLLRFLAAQSMRMWFRADSLITNTYRRCRYSIIGVAVSHPECSILLAHSSSQSLYFVIKICRSILKDTSSAPKVVYIAAGTYTETIMYFYYAKATLVGEGTTMQRHASFLIVVIVIA